MGGEDIYESFQGNEGYKEEKRKDPWKPSPFDNIRDPQHNVVQPQLYSIKYKT
jgi:hypothetical protein